MKRETSIDRNWLYQKYIMENLSIREVAKRKHCGSSTISRHLKKHGITKSNLVSRNKYNITKELLMKLYIEEKKSQSEISKIIGSDQFTIFHYMKKFNITARTYEENLAIGKHPMLGKENKWGHHTKEHKQKMSKKMTGENNPMFGKKLQEETKRLLSAMFSGENNPMYGRKGKDAPGYKPPEKRVNPIYRQIRTCFLYEQWRISCFERDHYTCLKCKDNKGHNLIVHHKKSFSSIVKENNIQILEEAQACKELWDVSNGITLCESCHRKHHSTKINHTANELRRN